ncbi:quinone oxidoreductase putative [Xylariaceae sp. FL0804]|nr:quinone oxidoreductase putative [Xylariaceae sp. FL0804]
MGGTMKAVDIKGGKGPASALFINEQTPVPEPRAGEALVRVRAFGLNRMDLIQREGNYPVPPQAPATLGVEFSGVIESFGPPRDKGSEKGEKGKEGGDEDFSVGDAVFGLAYGGAYAELIAVDTRMLIRKPDFLSWEQAAGIPETWITATQALMLVGEFAPGKSVLWHAGASGVSIAGAQLSRDAGASAVFATAGTDDKCRFVERELGVDRAFNYRTQPDWGRRVREAAPKGAGVDVIVDFVGASHFANNLEAAARDARWVSLGMMSGSRLRDVDVSALLFKRIRLEGSTLRSRDPEYQGRLRDRLAEYVPHFESGKLRVFIDQVFPMADIVKAHEAMEANTSTGKIICTVP